MIRKIFTKLGHTVVNVLLFLLIAIVLLLTMALCGVNSGDFTFLAIFILLPAALIVETWDCFNCLRAIVGYEYNDFFSIFYESDVWEDNAALITHLYRKWRRVVSRPCIIIAAGFILWRCRDDEYNATDLRYVLKSIGAKVDPNKVYDEAYASEDETK